MKIDTPQDRTAAYELIAEASKHGVLAARKAAVDLFGDTFDGSTLMSMIRAGEDAQREKAHQVIRAAYATGGVKAARYAAIRLFGPVGYLAEVVAAIRGQS